MSKLDIIALSGVVYKVKSTGPSTEPCGTPYESMSLFLLIGAYFANKKKTKFEPGQISHTNQKVYLLMWHGQWGRRRPASQARSEP